MDNPEKYDKLLAEIRCEYRSKLEAISDKMKVLQQEPSLCFTDSQAFSEMKIIAHNLFDSAATFGFQPVSEAAMPLERLLTDLAQDCEGGAIDEQNLKHLRLIIIGFIASVDESLTTIQ